MDNNYCICEQKYKKFAPLWTEDRQEVLNGFLKYGRVISPEEIDKYRFENEGQEPPEAKPTLEEYQKEVKIFLSTFIYRKSFLRSLKWRMTPPICHL